MAITQIMIEAQSHKHDFIVIDFFSFERALQPRGVLRRLQEQGYLSKFCMAKKGFYSVYYIIKLDFFNFVLTYHSVHDGGIRGILPSLNHPNINLNVTIPK